VTTTRIPEPEILSRLDLTPGRWDVDACRPVRGEPCTNNVDRSMKAPVDETEISRVIRAHEMMHAKVSPAHDMDKWIDRKIASHGSLIAVEELRVNFLCGKIGFNVKDHLADGGETSDGERLVAINDWSGAVQMTIAAAGTASLKPFLNGVRRHNRLWGTVLLDISKRAIKEMEKAARSGDLSSTFIHAETGLAPLGFIHTERIAQWIDRLCGMAPPEEQPEPAKGKSKESEDGKEEDSSATSHSNKNLREQEEYTERTRSIKPTTPEHTVPYWGTLNIGRLPLPVCASGTLGKKRVAANTGRSPRRLHRYMTDPQKRIFDKTIRGTGGIVIIDASGSMSFSRDHIKQIMVNAPGCTVLSYSDMHHGDNEPNAYILADKGKLATELPRQGSGNGVDYPAIEWAVKQRKRSSTPIIWVTDGGVCGPSQGFSAILAMQCIDFCKKNNIIVVPNVEESVKMLTDLRVGKTIKSHWPYMFRNTYREQTGTVLR